MHKFRSLFGSCFVFPSHNKCDFHYLLKFTFCYYWFLPTLLNGIRAGLVLVVVVVFYHCFCFFLTHLIKINDQVCFSLSWVSGYGPRDCTDGSLTVLSTRAYRKKVNSPCSKLKINHNALT